MRPVRETGEAVGRWGAFPGAAGPALSCTLGGALEPNTWSSDWLTARSFLSALSGCFMAREPWAQDEPGSEPYLLHPEPSFSFCCDRLFLKLKHK